MTQVIQSAPWDDDEFEARDGEIVLEEPITGARGFELVVGEDLDGQVETPTQLIRLLLDEAAETDDQG